MSNLMRFTGPDNNMPRARQALLRNRDELRGVIAGLDRLRAMQALLEAHVDSDAAEQAALSSAVAEDATLLRNKLK